MTSKERKALIDKLQKEAMYNNKIAFKNAEQLEKYLAKMYRASAKEIKEAVNKLASQLPKWDYAEANKYSRLKDLMTQINDELRKLGSREVKFMDKNLQNLYTDQYLRNIYTLGKGINVKMSFNSLNPKYIREAVSFPWSGEMFSDRIWDNKALLVKKLRETITQSLILGEGMAEVTKRLNKELNNSFYNAQRVARTEVMRISYVAEQRALKDNHVERVQYWATVPSERTCSTCGKLHKQEFELGKEPLLPIHPHCRCTYLPVLPELTSEHLNEVTKKIRESKDFNEFKSKVAKVEDGNTVIEEPTIKYDGKRIAEEQARDTAEKLINTAYNYADNKEIYDKSYNFLQQVKPHMVSEADWEKILRAREKAERTYQIIEDYHNGKQITPFHYAQRRETVVVGYRKIAYSYIETIELQPINGGQFYLGSFVRIPKADMEYVEKAVAELINKQPRVSGIGVVIDNQSMGERDLGYYFPRSDTMVLRSPSNFAKHFPHLEWKETTLHEFGHRFHNHDSKALTQIITSTKEWAEFKDLSEEYYTLYRKNRVVNFRREWTRFAYPVDAEDYYRDRSKDHFYKEIFAEATSVILDTNEEEKKKLRKYFPKVAEFVEKFYSD